MSASCHAAAARAPVAAFAGRRAAAANRASGGKVARAIAAPAAPSPRRAVIVAASASAAGKGAPADADVARAPRPEYVPSRIDDPNYVRVFDTTLRDGEQSPGATLTSSEKLDIARNLAKLGVDIIEAGFPIASPDDLEAVRNIAKIVGNERFEDGYVPVICGLSRANKKDIDASWEGVRHAIRPRIHTFIATSKIHMESKLRKTPDEVVQIAVDAVKYARSLGCDDVEFSPEDAGRSDPKFLHRILTAVVDAGATTLNIPDTVGVCLPEEFGTLIAGIKENVPGEYVISTHCQNDLGLSTANSLAGVANGARQVECTINGIGERAGNASLEEVAMAIWLRGQDKTAIYGAFTGINPVYIYPCSKMVKDFSGMSVQPHKAIVGANAFAHESGIHQDGMLKNKKTYEIIAPETIGYFRGEDSVGVVMGKHSGRHALSSKLKQLGYPLEGDALDEMFNRFKLVAEQKTGGVDDDEIIALVTCEGSQFAGDVDKSASWKLEDVQVVCGTMGLPTATVKMCGPDGMSRVRSEVGSGPVDATYKAIDGIVAAGKVELVEYSVNAVVEGIESLAETRVRVRPMDSVAMKAKSSGEMEARTFTASGADTDIVVASARAYVAATNRMIGFMREKAAAAAKEAEAEKKEAEEAKEAVAK